MPANQCIVGNEGYGLRKRHAEKGMCIPASSKRVHIISSARIVKSITSLCGCQVDTTSFVSRDSCMILYPYYWRDLTGFQLSLE